MYSFIEKDKISKRLANPSFIAVYRKLLARFDSAAACELCVNQTKLAQSLVYKLLAYMDEQEIFAATTGAKPAAEEPAARQPAPPAAAARKKTKFEEYPHIDWRNLDNPTVRTADSIYTDRVNLWSRLREIEDSLYEKEAPSELVKEFAEKSIRMELCFAELKSLNNSGKFIGKHPFIEQRSEREILVQLLRSNPSEFVKRMHNIELNISRYTSHLNSKKFSAEKKETEAEHLRKYRAQLDLYNEILQNVIDGRQR